MSLVGDLSKIFDRPFNFRKDLQRFIFQQLKQKLLGMKWYSIFSYKKWAEDGADVLPCILPCWGLTITSLYILHNQHTSKELSKSYCHPVAVDFCYFCHIDELQQIYDCRVSICQYNSTVSSYAAIYPCSEPTLIDL